jgi:hypothetical protein
MSDKYSTLQSKFSAIEWFAQEHFSDGTWLYMDRTGGRIEDRGHYSVVLAPGDLENATALMHAINSECPKIDKRNPANMDLHKELLIVHSSALEYLMKNEEKLAKVKAAIP